MTRRFRSIGLIAATIVLLTLALAGTSLAADGSAAMAQHMRLMGSGNPGMTRMMVLMANGNPGMDAMMATKPFQMP